MGFAEVVGQITGIGYEWHKDAILRNSRRNAPHVTQTIRDVQPDGRPCVVVGAGPSLRRQNILARLRGNITVVCVDGAYVACLKAGITPDYVVTLDPHPTRMVRWFGDPDLEQNTQGDDYFARQDLDVAFRARETNAENIALVDAHPTGLIIGTTAPENVVRRTENFARYWFAPLVDEGELTEQMMEATGCPAMNTGGTVGTAAWVFAQCILKSTNVAVVGMDFGYPLGTPLKNTQEYNIVNGDPDMFPVRKGFWGDCMASPTYWWYRQNFLDLLENNDLRVTNCSGGGLLCGDRVDCMDLDTWLASFL